MTELVPLPVFITRPNLFLCCWSFKLLLTELREIQLPETGVPIRATRSGVFLFPPLVELMSSGEEKGDECGTECGGLNVDSISGPQISS